jgi:4,5-dihydroxyphthalate decarboxylase
MMHLTTLLGDYPVTAALKAGIVTSPVVTLDFADVKVPNTAFQRVVRGLEFDVAELAIVTFLMAKARGVPLMLLPAVVVARFQHPFLVYNAERAQLTPATLAGRRVGIRSYTVTTVTWLRSILADDFGVDLDAIKWVTFEDAHVAGFPDPPGVERADSGKSMIDMLLAGEIDAAIVGAPVADPRIKTVLPDPSAAADAWVRKYDAIQLNHLVAVKSELCETQPDAVREVYRLLSESRRQAGGPSTVQRDLNPFGVEANRRNLEVAITAVHNQGLIPRRFSVDELIADPVREMA